MPNPTAIVNPAGDNPETILHYAKKLGREVVRRQIFNNIYGRARKPRSKKQIMNAAGIPKDKSQQAQNALDHLAKHHLISKSENDGSVKDGSRILYGKLETIRAHKDEILKFADDSKAAASVATKRSMGVKGAPSFVKIRSGRRSMQKVRGKQLRIAYLVTNPDPSAALNTLQEAKQVTKAIREVALSHKIDLRPFLAPSFDDLIDALNEFRPHVVHFSGHGGDETLLFDNERIGDVGGTALDFDTIVELLDAVEFKPDGLILMACDTVEGAKKFLDHTSFVVAMADSIGDDAASDFSVRFYRSLGSGVALENAVKQGKVSIKGKGYPDAELPTLLTRNEAKAKKPLVS
ncbi:CHAT domain-containing protein [Altererythrobacter arenosus]|uniref:CHAT domain-containing protein n=1 Tax=Altererythrobacter arenosus TaxID=3032592 RepID=A0ABY8FP87_9SPHN|nr:CHAT domain-containing protein [Altererythrobacter sp. CAU 1644]WFL76827.1 CHAT domain-containing protein [Altererythrobacter sp. CAU 1644]